MIIRNILGGTKFRLQFVYQPTRVLNTAKVATTVWGNGSEKLSHAPDQWIQVSESSSSSSSSLSMSSRLTAMANIGKWLGWCCQDPWYDPYIYIILSICFQHILYIFYNFRSMFSWAKKRPWDLRVWRSVLDHWKSFAMEPFGWQWHPLNPVAGQKYIRPVGSKWPENAWNRSPEMFYINIYI